ncbi:hypothetical protein [Sphaerisporangium aureirubrum]|uniref:Uncharacterized protein n=1 Tax=Sphaerisporangium aureirubrum TaxID=1544736 RepID=A0ABW1NL57_9ACTN
MPNFAKFVGTLTVGAVLTGGVVGLEVATIATTANAATTISMGGGGDYDDLFRNRNRSYNRNRNWSRNLARHYNRAAARSWARNWARHLNRSHSRSANVNRQAQTVNINLVFPDTLTSPVTATATIPGTWTTSATR